MSIANLSQCAGYLLAAAQTAMINNSGQNSLPIIYKAGGATVGIVGYQ
jgi:hypothetical protein